MFLKSSVSLFSFQHPYHHSDKPNPSLTCKTKDLQVTLLSEIARPFSASPCIIPMWRSNAGLLTSGSEEKQNARSREWTQPWLHICQLENLEDQSSSRLGSLMLSITMNLTGRRSRFVCGDCSLTIDLRFKYMPTWKLKKQSFCFKNTEIYYYYLFFNAHEENQC